MLAFVSFDLSLQVIQRRIKSGKRFVSPDFGAKRKTFAAHGDFRHITILGITRGFVVREFHACLINCRQVMIQIACLLVNVLFDLFGQTDITCLNFHFVGHGVLLIGMNKHKRLRMPQSVVR